MTESYAVAARLTMTSNVPEIVAQMVRGFETVNRLVKETQGNLGRLAAEFRTLSGGGRGIGRLVEQMEKLAAVKPNASMLGQMGDMAKLTREMGTAQAEMARSAQQTARAYQEMAAAAQRARAGAGSRGGGGLTPPGSATVNGWPGGIGTWAMHGGGGGPSGGGGGPAGNARVPPARGASHVSLVDAGIGAGMAGDAGTSFFQRSIEAELEVQKYLASFRQNTTITPGDLAAIRTKAEGIARSVPGTTIAENLHTIMDAFTIVGDLKEAMAGSETMAKLDLLFKSLPGGKGGNQGFSAAQAVELMQKFYDPKTHEVNIDALNKQVNAIGVVAAGTGGRQGADAYLAFTKQARVASMTANDKFLYEDAPAAMIAMGGSRFGTGLAALFTQFQTGTMTKNAANALKGAGLLDQGAQWKGGRVQDIGHHLRGADLAGTNLFDWVRKEILGPQGALAQRHIDPNDKVAVARFLSSFTGRQTGLGVLAEATLGMGGIDKEAGKLRQTNQNPLAVLQANDPNMKVREFKAAENEMMVQIGSALLGPAIEGLKSLTKALRDITDWAKANPTAAKDILLIGAGMAVLAKAAGELALIVFVGAPLVRGFGALAGALSPFSGGAAGTALTGLTAAGGAGSLAALAGGIVTLGAVAVGTIAVMKGFSALNESLGIKPGKDNGPSPHGNKFMDGLSDWWKGFSTQPGSDGHNSRGGTPGARHSSYVAPQEGAVGPRRVNYVTPAGGGTIQVHSAVYLDGRQVGRAVTDHQVRTLSGPSTGTTGFDQRTGLSGAMPA